MCQSSFLFGKGVIPVAHWEVFDEILVMAADLITHTEKLRTMALWGLFVFVKMHVC